MGEFLLIWALFTFLAALVVFPDGGEVALDPSIHVPVSAGLPISLIVGLAVAASFYR